MNTSKTFATVSMIGLGYIGLPTAAMFAARRVRVIGVDINQHAVDTINRGEIHIVEPELDMIVRSAVTEGYLRATTRPEAADAYLIAVPTPFKGEHEPDVSYVQAAAESIAPVLKSGNLVVLESTSSIGSPPPGLTCASPEAARASRWTFTSPTARSGCYRATSCASWSRTTASSAA
jgi:UDP-N-acetyl-D-mannosaminuronic acid dehydrogenase